LGCTAYHANVRCRNTKHKKEDEKKSLLIKTAKNFMLVKPQQFDTRKMESSSARDDSQKVKKNFQMLKRKIFGVTNTGV
jgi:hypothetical protein